MAGGKKSRNEVMMRRAKVKELLVRGFSPRQISVALNIPFRTLYRDMAHLREDFIREMESINWKVEIKKIIDSIDDIMSKSYLLYETVDKQTKHNALSVALRSVFAKMKLLQLLGILESEQKIEVNQNVNIDMQKFDALYQMVLKKMAERKKKLGISTGN